ncbi:MAG: inositol monophosphatase [Phototrophicales bacterium]|nr:MAG: inositol monophosphatase [Phototrophicales bacterium]
MNIVVASTNPVKIECTRLGFEQVFPNVELTLSGVSVPSGVSDQPMSDDETLQGALNRATNAQLAEPNADFWVGIEGGVADHQGELHCFAWVVVQSISKLGKGRTATFILPDEVAKLVRQGYELGHADDIVFGRQNSKQANGSVGILTKDILTRTSFYVPAVILALIPFIQPHLTFYTIS